jgi:peptidoglycan hydrolase-like protein with peptidoglycan-binding domain
VRLAVGALTSQLVGSPRNGMRVDGIFGPRTDAAVRGFQHSTGLTTDDLVGPQTWQALISATSSS